MKPNVTCQFRHIGIPTNEQRTNEVFSAAVGTYTSDDAGNLKIPFHRFAAINDSGVPIELIQTHLIDEEIWERARSGQRSIYRNPHLKE